MSRAETSVPRMCAALGGWRAPVAKSTQFGGQGVRTGARIARAMMIESMNTPTIARR